MNKSVMFALGGFALIAIGAVVYNKADNLTTSDGRPNEGGYIRSKLLGGAMVLVGTGMVGHFIIKSFNRDEKIKNYYQEK